MPRSRSSKLGRNSAAPLQKKERLPTADYSRIVSESFFHLQLGTCGGVKRRVVIFFRGGWTAAPGALDFRPELQHILETWQIEGSIFREATGLGHERLIRLHGHIRGEMPFFGHQGEHFSPAGRR